MNKSKTSKKVIAIMLMSIFIYVGVAVYTQIKVGVELMYLVYSQTFNIILCKVKKK